MTNYYAIPATFNNSYYYGAYYTTYSVNIDSARQALWQIYIDSYFGSTSSAAYTYLSTNLENPQITASLYSLLRPDSNLATWPTSSTSSPLTFYADNIFIEGMFGMLLRDFFYHYAPAHLNASDFSSSSAIQSAFTTYLSSSARDSTTYKQNTILIWIWELLTQMLTSINNTTLTQGGYLLAMTSAENAAAQQLANINYRAQANDQDYTTQAANMNMQTNADVYRAMRSSNGKQGQIAQSMITSLRDAATQQAQLMATIIQNMESMYQAIMRK